MLKRILALPLIALASAPLLSGCSTDSLTAQGIAQAAETTSAKGGSKIAMRTTTTIPGAGAITMTGDGVVDAKRGVGRVTMRFGGPATRGAAMTQEMIIDRFTIYMRSPLFSQALQSRKTWLKVDLDKVGKGLGVDFSQLSQMGQDPSQALQMLKAVSGDVKKVGTQDVRGVRTTHYSATIDFTKYPAAVPAAQREAVRKSMDSLVKLGGTRTVPVDVWLDDDNVVRRFGQSIKMQAGEAAGMQMNMTYDLYDFGTKVDVKAPPAAQVQDLTSLVGG